jgi:hypothetical protein
VRPAGAVGFESGVRGSDLDAQRLDVWIFNPDSTIRNLFEVQRISRFRSGS